MKKAILILLSIMYSGLAFAAKTTPNKVGYVDMQKAITETKSGKAAFKKLKSFQGTKQKQLDAKKKEIEKERAELEKKFAVFSNEKKAQVQQDFQKKALAAEKYFRDSQLELAKKEKALLEPVVKGLREAIAKYGEKQGYAMIFEKTGSSVLFAEKGTDLTAKVVKSYGK